MQSASRYARRRGAKIPLVATDWGADVRIGVVTECFGERPLDDVLAWLGEAAPAVTDLELASGGYPPTPHCDRALLLGDPGVRARWFRGIEERGFRLAALNAWGNPLHPDADIARAHDRDLRETILLAAELGVDRVLALAGCPGDVRPRFAAGGWLPYLEGEHERQWHEAGAAYWSDISDFARHEHPDVLICIELHPGTLVYNAETFGELGACGENLAANIDPSHFFWMQMDPFAVVENLSRIGYAHLKDVVFDPRKLALNGLLDHRWPDPVASPWRFATLGHGHAAAWWRDFLDALASRGVATAAIEHEDPLVAPEQGVAEAATMLTANPEVAA
jgi:sugar phosphate isomerase/epimerase